ncbi:MAG TPA: hypothetical protein VF121_16515 [Thermoanaerobaculia bacterium]|nr:hypothetical protein [Thermoanaerobaculia bacterium]
MLRLAPPLAAVLALALRTPAAGAQGGSGTLTATFDAPTRALTLIWKAGPPLDELRVIVPARLAGRLNAVELPSAWFLSREAGSLTLRGPAAPPPVRFRLKLAEGKPPREIAVEARSGERPVFYTDALAVGAAPRPAASLTGLLRLPPLAAAGDPVLVQVLDPERTPPEGRWTIAGAAAVPFDPRVSAWEPARARRVELELAAGVTASPGRAELARLAAALAAEGPGRRRTRFMVRPLLASELAADSAIEEEEFAVEELPVGEGEGTGGAATDAVEEAPPLEVELGMGAVPAAPARGPAAAYAVRAADPEPFGLAGEAEVFIVAGRDGGELLADLGPGEEIVRLYEVAAAGGAEPPRIVAVAPADGEGAPPPGGPFVAVAPVSAAESLAFDVADVEPLPPGPPPELLATLWTTELPDDLAPGAPLAVTYTDPTGEVLVEAVAEARVGTAAARQGPPRLDGAGTPALGAETVCVCGLFPGPLAWRGLTLDGVPLFPVAASTRVLWLPLPADLGPGRHTVAGLAAARFPPGEEVTFELAAEPEEPSPLPGTCSCLAPEP